MGAVSLSSHFRGLLLELVHPVYSAKQNHNELLSNVQTRFDCFFVYTEWALLGIPVILLLLDAGSGK